MRTFSEQEARDVFARAARDQQAAQTAADPSAGLTLDELQEIGRASGLDPAFVAAAARAVAVGVPESRRDDWLGVPLSVAHTALLPDPPSDDLWEPLVADARRTFGARGRVETVGRLREWRNGNLVLALGPAGEGSQAHFQTRRPDGLVPVVSGAAVAVLSLVALLTSLASGGDAVALTIAVLLAVLAAGLGGGGLAAQRRWSATRAGQMRDVAERARTRARTPDTATDAAVGTPVETSIEMPGRSALGQPAPVSLGDDWLGDDLFDGDALGDDAAPRRRTRS